MRLIRTAPAGRTLILGLDDERLVGLTAIARNCSFARRRICMPYVEVGTENSGAIEIYYEDHGVGSPAVLIHAIRLTDTPGRSKKPRFCRRATASLPMTGQASEPRASPALAMTTTPLPPTR